MTKAKGAINWFTVLKVALFICAAVGAVLSWLYFSKAVGAALAGILSWFGGGGKAARKKVKARAKKKHDLIADDPDAIQRDNLDRLRRG